MKSKNPKTLNSQETQETPSPSEFSLAITRVAVAQICHSAGFSASQLSALQTLTRVATTYVQALARAAASRATSCSRTQTNIFDLVHALEAMGSVQGFQGASDVNQSLLDSIILKNIVRFVYSIEEVPFAKPIRRRDDYHDNNSITRSASSSQNSHNLETNSRRRKSHVPNWLPAFPDPSSYKIAEKEKCNEDPLARPSGRNNSLEKSLNCVESRDDFQVNWPCRTPGSPDTSTREIAAERLACGDDEKGELPAKRARVRFKMGVEAGGVGVGLNLRNGICRGGKRVCCHSGMDEDEEEKTKKKKKNGFNRSR